MTARGSASTSILIALLAGCTTHDAATRHRDPSPGLSAGMTMADVRSRAGEPRRVVTTTSGERWSYADGTAFERPEHAVVTTLTFEGDRLGACPSNPHGGSPPPARTAS